MDDVEEYVDANENDSNLSRKFNFKAFFKDYWLAIFTAIACLLAIIQSSFIKLKLSEDIGIPILMLPANFFFRHVRGFVVLFVIFSSANKAAMLYETKRSSVKRRVLFHYFLSTAISLVVSISASYLIIMRRPSDVTTQFFSKFKDVDYTPLNNFIRFFRGLFVHDIPGNILTTRLENYNEFGLMKLRNGLGDGYNAPGFVIFGSFLACSTYFLGKDGEILRNLIQLIHRSMVGIYWMLLCYSPIALYFGGIVQYDIVQGESLYGFLCLRYLLLLTSVIVITLLQVFIILPFLHFCRTRKFGYDVIIRLLAIFPEAFVGGSTVRMIDKTKLYLKSKRFSGEAIDSYFHYCTLINGAGVVSGFATNAVFALKLNDHDFDWAVVFKIVTCSFLMTLPATEYIQGYMFGIIFFLNTSMINPDFIIPILLVDWLHDRLRTIANIVADALTVDYIESMNKTSHSSTQSLG